MSFKVKIKEWRRRIVHVLALALIVTSIPSVPVRAQTDAQDMPKSTILQESISDCDAEEQLNAVNGLQSDVEEEMDVSAADTAVMMPASTEAGITAINAVVAQDIFYYEVDNIYIGNVISSLKIIFDDGTMETCSPWDDVWNSYGLIYNILDAEGSIAQTDENYKYPVGDFICRFSISGSEVSCDVPVKVVSLKDVGAELTAGETIAGLTGTENYNAYDHEGGHWFKMEMDEPGRYQLSKSKEGMLQIVPPNNASYGRINSMCEYVQVSEAGTYYCYVKGSDTFDVTLAKLPNVISMRVEVKRDLFYYEVENLNIYNIISTLELTLDNGTTETCSLWDNVWNRYSISCGIFDAEGKPAQMDDNNMYPAGDYIYKIYISGSDISCEVPVKVVVVENVAAELTEGETISGLSGTRTFVYNSFGEGHWLKMEFAKPGKYELSKTAAGYIRLKYPNGNITDYYNNVVNIQVTEAGTYYCYVKGSDTFDVTLTRIPSITAIDAYAVRNIFYYELESMWGSNVVSSLKLMLDNGTVETCRLWDTLWNKYDLVCEILDAEGNIAQRDQNYKYPIGDYTCKIYSSDSGISLEVPVKVMAIKDAAVIAMPQEAIPLSEAVDAGFYKLEITEDGLYELAVSDEVLGSGNIVIYDENGAFIKRQKFSSEGNYSLGLLNKGCYYAEFNSSAANTDAVTVKLVRKGELSSLEYSGDRIVFNYGEWGYRTESDVNSGLSGNVSTRPLAPNHILSGNDASLPVALHITIDGILSDGSVVEIPFNGYQWQAYMCSYILCDKEGDNLCTDYNGYLSNGEYLIKISAYGGASVEIPFQVVGGPSELNSLSYTGEVQRFKYGTWGYSTQQLLSGNQFDDLKQPDTELSQIVSGNNVLALEFSLTGETKEGESEVIPYGSKLWKSYVIKTYFYDEDGKPVYTNNYGYIPTGSYTMTCVAYNGLTCGVPVEVYPDVGKETEEELETAVNKMLDAAGALSDESLAGATKEEKKDAVNALLQKIEEISANHNIAEIGSVTAEKAMELTSKLTEAEKQIEEFLGTSVTVKAKDTEAEDMNLAVKNALLSVPAGENAEVRVSSTEVPINVEIKQEQAVAVKLELVTETDEKIQLQAPVIITMKIPASIRTDEKISVYHYRDNESAAEVISVLFNSDNTISFTTGSFSTFVIANVAEGSAVSGKVTSFGSTMEQAVVKLLDNNGTVVAETNAAGDSGIYQFANVAAGTYTLQVSKENHVPRDYEITVGGGAVTQDVELHLLGDINGDGSVNARDKKLLYNHIAGLTLLGDYDFAVADVNADGNVNARDKKIIYNHIAGISLLW